jgi:hypothetical protein
MNRLKTCGKILVALITVTAFLAFNQNIKTGKIATRVKGINNQLRNELHGIKTDTTSFDVVEIIHTVKDYAVWRPYFDTDSTIRNQSGLHTVAVAKNIDSTNNIFIVFKMDDLAKAKTFAADPRLKDVMQKAGVISKPNISFWHVIRMNPDSHEKQSVIITHRVKDFDAWVKVFDKEGKDARASQGLYDVVLLRGIEDPNMVQLVFDIKDLAQAKAAIYSDDKKKLMMSAGVQGKPTVAFYTDAD